MPIFQKKSPATELEKLREERTKLDARLQTAERELATLRNISADVVLDQVLTEDGAARRKTRERIRELEGERVDLQVAMRALDARIQAARRAVSREKAEKVRAEAAKLQAELDAHRAKTSELKKALEDHDGQSYGPVAGWLLEIGAPMPNLPPAMKLEHKIRELLDQAVRIETAEPEADNVVPIAPIIPPMQPARGRYQAG